MRSARFNHLLAGTAVALALALTPYAGGAFAASETEITAAVPMPESADLPPPSIKDITPTSQPAAETKAETKAPAETIARKPAPAAAEITSSVAATTGTQFTTAAAGDTAVVDKLREQLAAGKFDRILGGKKERGTIEAYYASREFAPLWIADGAMTDRAKSAATYLAGVDAEGLEPSEYPIPQIKAGMEPEALAEAEIKFTDSVLTFARHAMSGRVHYTRVSGDIIYDLAKPDPANVLARVANAKDAGSALDSLNPPQPQYKALKAKLAELRHAPPPAAKAKAEDGKPEATVRVPDGKSLNAGMSDPRVVTLRKRLKITENPDSPLYDDAVVIAVKTFQTEADITADGVLGPNTLRILNGEKKVVHRPSVDPIDVVIANMERWRWVPRDLGHTYVMVNIPDFTLRVVRDEKLVWKTKIVTGKPNLPTPLLTADMKFITVNPTWNVPPSIIQNEYLPALQADPQAMERIGLKVEQNADGTVRIWQPPGDRNALGRIRFNFPNKFLVYQHDTPDKYLFAKDVRAFSHGCMRVENPLKYGEVLLGLALPNEHYTAERLQKMFGGSEININFPQSIPVHITYQSAFVEDGKLEIRDDIYGRDQRLLAILKGSDRKMADIAIDRPKGSSSAPVKMPPGTFGGSGGGGFTFFERLFGSTPEPSPKPRARVGANDRRTTPR
jgi:L,D-transpeptidase YcbB